MVIQTWPRQLLLLCILGAMLLTGMFAVIGRRPAGDCDSASSPAPTAGPLTVQAIGSDFYWNFRFPGPDEQFGTDDDVSTTSAVHLPRDREVVFLVGSEDYIYTMSIPKLGLRRIAVPQMLHKVTFRTTATGTFDVVADPLCSVSFLHNDDMGQVIVQSRAEFDSWYQALQ